MNRKLNERRTRALEAMRRCIDRVEECLERGDDEWERHSLKENVDSRYIARQLRHASVQLENALELCDLAPSLLEEREVVA